MLRIISKKNCVCSSRRYQMLINFVLFLHINMFTPYFDPLGLYKPLAIAKHSFPNFNNISVTCVEMYFKMCPAANCWAITCCYIHPGALKWIKGPQCDFDS